MQFQCTHPGCKNRLRKTATEPGLCRRHQPGWKPKRQREVESEKKPWHDAMWYRLPGSFESGKRR